MTSYNEKQAKIDGETYRKVLTETVEDLAALSDWVNTLHETYSGVLERLDRERENPGFRVS